MGILIFIVLLEVAVLFGIIAIVLSHRQRKNNKEMDHADNMKNNMGTQDLFLETLTKIGCQYEVDEDDRIAFAWQGGHFVADAANDCPFVVVWYQFWAEYELYDIDMISRVKRVINDTNIAYNLNVIYSINEAGSTFHVHSKKHFLFVPQVQNLDGYLQAILGQFFTVRRYVETELDKQKNEEERINK